MRFKHTIIDTQTPGSENDVCLIADVDGDGHNDVIIGGKVGEGNLVWYEYPNWTRHTIGTANLEAGGATMDITGSGLPDLIVGRPHWKPEDPGRELYWFENPGDSGTPWQKHVIYDRFHKYHDQLVGDIDADGRDEIIFASQTFGVLGYFDLPEDPRGEPWDPSCLHIIAEDIGVEGLALGDVDGDGEVELIAGPNWFKRLGARWVRHPIGLDYELTRVQVGDLSGDGRLDVVLAEGESECARLAVVSGFPDWRVQVLSDDLFNPHSLELADFTGDGRLDIMVAEMGLGRHPDPRVLIYRNLGDGRFDPFVVASGRPTHEAKVGVFGDDSLPSIVGKPYRPGDYVEMWRNLG